VAGVDVIVVCIPHIEGRCVYQGRGRYLEGRGAWTGPLGHLKRGFGHSKWIAFEVERDEGDKCVLAIAHIQKGKTHLVTQ
jgi:hypothetical protein